MTAPVRVPMTLVAVLLMGPAWASAAGPLDALDPVGGRNREGNDHYRSGNFEEAAKSYSEGNALDPGRAELLYNLGNALGRLGRHDEATATYERVLEEEAPSAGERSLTADTWYNLGNARLSAGDAGAAIGAYRRALLDDPEHQLAKRNLEIAIEQAEQQTPPPQNEDENSDQEQERPDAPQADPDRPEEQQPREDPDGPRPEPRMSEEDAERLLRNFDQMEKEERERDEGAPGRAGLGGLDW